MKPTLQKCLELLGLEGQELTPSEQKLLIESMDDSLTRYGEEYVRKYRAYFRDQFEIARHL